MSKTCLSNDDRRMLWSKVLMVFVVGAVLCADAFAVLANNGKRGLRAYTIEGVLRLPDDEIDIGTAALILSREWGTPKTSHIYRRKIDDMAEAIQELLKDKHIPLDYHAIPIINEYLFEEMGFGSVDNADNPEDLFLHVVLEKKRGYCLSLSVLYLSIAERLGLPMYGVVVPGHFFVRYDDGKKRYNIETTAGGGIADDAHYIEKFRPPNRPKTLYMKNLTKKQTLGCFFNNLGNSYMDVGETDTAFRILQKAVQINPLLSEANMNLGNIYLQKQMPYQAIAQYEAALAILGHDAKAFNNLGAAYMQLQDYRKAESYYKTALQLDPDYSDVHRNLARAMHLQGRHYDAITRLQSAIGLKPDDTESLLLLGQIYRQVKEYDLSEKYLLQALRIDHSLISAHIALGFTYYDMGRLDAAMNSFQAGLKYDSELSQAYYGMAQIYHDQQETDNEIWAYERVLSIDPSMVAALQNLGNAYLKKNNPDAAIQAYEKGIEYSPGNAALHYNLAVTLATLERHPQAISEFLKAIELEPSSGQAYNGIAISYYRLKDYDSAKVYARKAKALGFNVQDALLEL